MRGQLEGLGRGRAGRLFDHHRFEPAPAPAIYRHHSTAGGGTVAHRGVVTVDEQRFPLSHCLVGFDEQFWLEAGIIATEQRYRGDIAPLVYALFRPPGDRDIEAPL